MKLDETAWLGKQVNWQCGAQRYSAAIGPIPMQLQKYLKMGGITAEISFVSGKMVFMTTSTENDTLSSPAGKIFIRPKLNESFITIQRSRKPLLLNSKIPHGGKHLFSSLQQRLTPSPQRI